MEELMPELVLSQVDSLSFVACRFVSTTWMNWASPPAPGGQEANQHHRLKDLSKLLAARGWLGMLKWARANGCPWDAETCASAARGGHLEVLQWARANGCPSYE